jgi:hypothetical protein
MKQPVPFALRAFLSIVLATFSLQAWGLDCVPADINLTNQAEVDALSVTGCTTVTGNLSITGSITSLEGLSNLTSVGGELSILSNANLSNLDGLSGLKGEISYLNIRSNAMLTNVDGLTNLASVGNFLTIEQNNVLGNCSALALLLGWPDGPPNDEVVGNILIQNNATGCNSV